MWGARPMCFALFIMYISSLLWINSFQKLKIWFRGRHISPSMPHREARLVAESSEGPTASKSDRTGRNPGMTRLVRRSSSGVWRYCVFLSCSNIKYRTIYRISQELFNETIESMDSRIADIIRNNGEKRKSIKVPFSTGTQARYCVQTILARFCDGSRQTSYDLRLLLGRFKTVFDDFSDQWNKQWTKSFFYRPATKPWLTVKNRH